MADGVPRADGTAEDVSRSRRRRGDARHRPALHRRAFGAAGRGRDDRTGGRQRRLPPAGAFRPRLLVPGATERGALVGHAAENTLAIVIPCYNEAAMVERFYGELARALEPVDID